MSAPRSPFSLPNIKAFLIFRVLYNARFYYPIYALIFLDMGLSTEQFLILNMIWGIGIVLLEVPSGALADSIGRRKLMIAGAACMILEMGIFTFAPMGNVQLLFALLVANRILSGISEALVSGADEALAFDTLKEEGLEHTWNRVLARLMQIQALAAVVSLLVGSALYDERLLNGFFTMLGMDWELVRAQTLRIPVFLTLVSSIIVFLAAIKMEEPEASPEAQGEPLLKKMTGAARYVMSAGLWILKTPFASAVILGGCLVDAFLRTFVTFASQYYQIIRLPEAVYGVIGAVMSGLGFFWPSLARRLAERFGPLGNFLNIAALTLVGLVGISFFMPYVGVVWVLPVMAGWSFLNYFVSQYLNQATASEQRATVLSFKGLSFNLGYSVATWSMALLMNASESRVVARNPEVSERVVENAKLVEGMPVLPIAFVIGVALFLIFVFLRVSPKDVPEPNQTSPDDA